MKLPQTHPSMLKTYFLFCLATLFTVTSVMFTTVVAQDEERITIRHSLPKHVPLKVELLNLDSNDVLSDFEVKVTNVGEKPIYSLRFEFETVDVKMFGSPISISFRYGRHELSGGANEGEGQKLRPTDEPINLDETVTFKLSKTQARVRKRNIETGLYQKPLVYELVFIDLMYGDGTGFSRSGPVQKKNLNDSESKACLTPEPLAFFRPKAFSLVELLFFKDKSLDLAQAERIQPPGDSLCAEGCAFIHCERVFEYRIGGCPLPEDPDVEEPNLYVDWVAGVSDCGNNCKNLRLQIQDCVTDGYTTYEYVAEPCGEIPPPPPPDECIPTGHGEGAEGYEYECGDGINNDCDVIGSDCQEARCRPTGYCADACDLDGDQVDNPSCGGNDCDEQSPYRSQIPEKDANGNLLQESSVFDCNDSLDNDCDIAIDYPADPSCPPPPDPDPTPDPLCLEMQIECENGGGIWKGCLRGCYSPIVIDIDGDGFDLTNGPNGIYLDLTGEGTLDKVSWTSANSDDSWLALDRNGNGVIDSGMELFGNFTDQPLSISVQDRNGFLALAVFDAPEKGGNGDGKITNQDSIFNSLRLWRDINHNGLSETNELQNLSVSPVRLIDLDYKVSRRTDTHGNRFKYRAKVKDHRGEQVGRWAWDVFLLRGTP